MIDSHAFRSLRQRNFRIYYLGQLVSLNGTWMQSVAQSWLIYRLTGSGLMLGLVGTLTLLPNLVLGIYGGWLADRFARRRLLIIVQTLAMAQAVLLGILTLAGWVSPWQVLVLALFLGLVQAVETPVRQSFLAELVPRDDLPNAIALNSSVFHLARFIGPAIAGVMVAWVGEGPVFLINALSFVAVLFSLLHLRVPSIAAEGDRKRGLSGILAGYHYAVRHRLTSTLLALVAVVSLLGGSAVVLMPLFVADVFGRGPESLGAFMAMLGAGSLLAALRLAQQRDFRLLERRVALAAVAVGGALLVFSTNELYGLALGILFVLGFASTTVFASSNALIQLSVPDELRGRTMALFTVCLHGMVSVGQLVMGAVADLLGAALTAGLGASLLVVCAVVLAFSLYRIEQH